MFGFILSTIKLYIIKDFLSILQLKIKLFFRKYYFYIKNIFF